ncbi:MAG: PDZ domain-containing protein, partial [Planctomycetes bacterium]|nr:PDZ domain-containing protein [Planctomycetota bacterium]
MNSTRRLKVGAVLTTLAWPLIAGAAPPGAVVVPLSPPVMVGTPVPIADAPSPPQVGGAWLGVELAPVPAALASHLKLGTTGVMIRNIVKDSPADRAGLDRYDVIVQLDGKPIADGHKGFVQHVRDKKPGDPLEMLYYRGGEERSTSVTLGTTPGPHERMDRKYEDDPDVAQRRIFGLRGKILRPGPEGWVLDDLGEMPLMPGLQKWLEERPGRPRTDREEIIEGRRVDREGQVLQVRKDKDGTIEVRRYRTGTPPDQVEPKKYENLEQLKKADPEAAELLDATSRPSGKDDKAIRDNLGRLRKGMKEYDGKLRDYQDALRDYQDAMREYMKKYQHEFEYRVPSPETPKWHEWSERFFPSAPGAPMVR